MRRLSTLFVLPAFVLLLAGGPAAAQAQATATTPDGATKFMTGLSGEALRVLRSNDVSMAEKEGRVRKLLAENFDLDLIGRFVIGPAWRTASPDQRTRYQEVFREFVLRTYSRRLGGYSGQTFEITGARPVGKRDVLVNTRIMRPSAPPIEAGWRVRSYGAQGHKILDVVVAGVSMAVTQRSEFRAVIRKQGMEGLIETLRAQVSTYAARGS